MFLAILMSEQVATVREAVALFDHSDLSGKVSQRSFRRRYLESGRGVAHIALALWQQLTALYGDPFELDGLLRRRGVVYTRQHTGSIDGISSLTAGLVLTPSWSQAVLSQAYIFRRYWHELGAEYPGTRLIRQEALI